MPLQLQFRVIMPKMLVTRGVDWMRINRTFSLPVPLVIKMKSLRNQSATVERAVSKYLNEKEEFELGDLPLFQLMSAVAARTDDESLKVLLYSKIKGESTKTSRPKPPFRQFS
jgi:hypothetical protein